VRSDFEAISSLPRLKSIQLKGFIMSEDVVYPLARCKRLRNLHIWVDFALLHPILLIVGRNLESLSIPEMNAEAVDGVVGYCPDLEYLYFNERNPNQEIQSSLEQS
jgi:hypothetical protein